MRLLRDQHLNFPTTYVILYSLVEPKLGILFRCHHRVSYHSSTFLPQSLHRYTHTTPYDCTLLPTYHFPIGQSNTPQWKHFNTNLPYCTATRALTTCRITDDLAHGISAQSAVAVLYCEQAEAKTIIVNVTYGHLWIHPRVCLSEIILQKNRLHTL
jgi:hypothetical protein